MKKLTPFKTLAAFALAASLIFISCQPPTDEVSDIEPGSPADCFQKIIIPNEIITGNTLQNYARNATGISYNNDAYKFEQNFLGSDSRGTVFLYMLKYDLHKLKQFRKLSGFGSTCDIKDFVDANGDYATPTKKYICDSWGNAFYEQYFKVTDGQCGFDMGRLYVTKDDAGVITCYQKDALGSFDHYITLTPNSYNSYDIDFYAFEINAGSIVSTSIYYENTTRTNEGFKIIRRGTDLPSAVSFQQIVNDTATYKNEYVTSYINYSLITGSSFVTYKKEAGDKEFLSYTDTSTNNFVIYHNYFSAEPTYSYGKQKNGRASTYIEEQGGETPTTKYNLAILESNNGNYELIEITDGNKITYDQSQNGYSSSYTSDDKSPYIWHDKSNSSNDTNVFDVFNHWSSTHMYVTSSGDHPVEAFYVTSLKAIGNNTETNDLKIKENYSLNCSDLKTKIGGQKTTLETEISNNEDTFKTILILRNVISSLNNQQLYTQE